ncbi:MAG: FAD-dependent thymidylate synthase, partial [Acidimicrobiia bacterium]
DQPQRGGVWVDYLTDTASRSKDVASQILGDIDAEPRPLVNLLEWDHEAEDKLIAAMLYAVSDLPEDQITGRVRGLSAEERRRIVDAYIGERSNRRHRPGRALERIDYRFDVICDYGAFRDLQRHRMLTMEWQDLTPRHGYEVPDDLEELGVADDFRRAMDLSAGLWGDIHPDLPAQAQYAVCMAYRIRFVMQMNAREAMHLIELRSSAQGHPSYRAIAHELHRQIREVAGHHLVADMMKHVDYSEVDLERLEAERRAERRRHKSSA